MARARKTANETEAAQGENGQFTCPECGKTFARAAALGSHRRRAHGVAGASAQKRTRPTRRSRSSAASRTTQASRSSQSRQGGTRTTGIQSTNGHIDRDALLKTLFPNGVPAREAVLRRVNAWLDEAEQLASSK